MRGPACAGNVHYRLYWLQSPQLSGGFRPTKLLIGMGGLYREVCDFITAVSGVLCQQNHLKQTGTPTEPNKYLCTLSSIAFENRF